MGCREAESTRDGAIGSALHVSGRSHWENRGVSRMVDLLVAALEIRPVASLDQGSRWEQEMAESSER